MFKIKHRAVLFKYNEWVAGEFPATTGIISYTSCPIRLCRHVFEDWWHIESHHIWWLFSIVFHLLSPRMCHQKIVPLPSANQLLSATRFERVGRRKACTSLLILRRDARKWRGPRLKAVKKLWKVTCSDQFSVPKKDTGKHTAKEEGSEKVRK